MQFNFIISALIASVACHYTDFAGKAQVKTLSPTTHINLGQLQYYQVNKVSKGHGHFKDREIVVGPLYYTIPRQFFSRRFINTLPVISDLKLEQNVNRGRLFPRSEPKLILSNLPYHGFKGELGSPNVNIAVDSLRNENQGIAGKKTYLERRADIIYDPNQFGSFQAGTPDIKIAAGRVSNTNQGVAFDKSM